MLAMETKRYLTLLLTLAGWLPGMQPAQAADSLGTDWYKAGFETRFPPSIPFLPDAGGWAVLYQSENDYLGEEKTDIFLPVSADLNAALSAADTDNPFRPLYPAIYSETGEQKRLESCPVLGVAFELDDNPQTQEWVISFSAERCLHFDAAEKLLKGDDKPHKWVLQQAADGQYRVLAEGDGILYVTRQDASDGFREIRTRFFIKRAYPDNPLQCGGAEFTWQYQDGRYQPSDTLYMAQDCAPLYFPDATGLEWERKYAEYEQQVKPLVDEWIAQLR